MRHIVVELFMRTYTRSIVKNLKGLNNNNSLTVTEKPLEINFFQTQPSVFHLFHAFREIFLQTFHYQEKKRV